MLTVELFIIGSDSQLKSVIVEVGSYIDTEIAIRNNQEEILLYNPNFHGLIPYTISRTDLRYWSV